LPTNDVTSDESWTPNAPFVLNTSGCNLGEYSGNHSKNKPTFFLLAPFPVIRVAYVVVHVGVHMGEVSLKWINSKINF
jgi:hypothetical protein